MTAKVTLISGKGLATWLDVETPGSTWRLL